MILLDLGIKIILLTIFLACAGYSSVDICIHEHPNTYSKIFLVASTYLLLILGGADFIKEN